MSKQYSIKIKSSITPWVWYYDKIGQMFRGTKHQTDSLFWFPGKVFDTAHGYIHENDAEIIEEIESAIPPIQNN